MFNITVFEIFLHIFGLLIIICKLPLTLLLPDCAIGVNRIQKLHPSLVVAFQVAKKC